MDAGVPQWMQGVAEYGLLIGVVLLLYFAARHYPIAFYGTIIDAILNFKKDVLLTDNDFRERMSSRLRQFGAEPPSLMDTQRMQLDVKQQVAAKDEAYTTTNNLMSCGAIRVLVLELQNGVKNMQEHHVFRVSAMAESVTDNNMHLLTHINRTQVSHLAYSVIPLFNTNDIIPLLAVFTDTERSELPLNTHLPSAKLKTGDGSVTAILACLVRRPMDGMPLALIEVHFNQLPLQADIDNAKQQLAKEALRLADKLS